MKTSTKQLLTVVVIVLLAVVVYAGSAFAQDDVTTAPTPAPNLLQRMQERLGLEGWERMIQQMTQRHGSEFTSQMLQRMAQQENCPCLDGESCEPGMGQGMHGGMMGRNMMARGAMRWGFNQQMGPRFWNSTPTEAPTATPAE